MKHSINNCIILQNVPTVKHIPENSSSHPHLWASGSLENVHMQWERIFQLVDMGNNQDLTEIVQENVDGLDLDAPTRSDKFTLSRVNSR